MKRSLLKKIISLSIIICSMSIPVQAAWVKSTKGSWSWVENQSKAIGWKYINNKWYYFDNNGEMKTGWLYDNNKWYCLSDNGDMFIGWIYYSKKWYFMQNDGSMKTGWLTYNNNKYYLNDNGVMATGTIEINGDKYIFDDNGAFISSNSENVSTDNKLEIKEPIQSLTDVTDRNLFTNSNINVTIVEDLKNDDSENKEDKESDDSEKLDDFSYDDMDLKDDALPKDIIRTEAPEIDNKYYYSDLNIFYKAKLSPPFYSGNKQIQGNCTWYAWGRIAEITGKVPIDAGLNGNAYEWWQANKKSGKFKYGSEPKVGAIAVWKSSLPYSGGCGHVAVVEKIKDNKIYISESSWHGSVFKYREIYSTDYIYGYIYLDEPNN